MRESFVFFRSFFEAIEELDEKKQLKLYKSIAKFALNDEIPTNLKGIEKAIFSLIEPQLTANNKRYEVSRDCAKFGKLGGRPKKNENPKGLEKKTLKGFENETLNVNVNVNDNVNDNVNVNVNEKGFLEKGKKTDQKSDPYTSKTKDEFVAEYEKVFNVKPFLLAPQLNKLAELKAEIPDFKENMRKAIQKLKNIEFSDINFTPSASWLLREDNFARVLNGEFDKKENVGLTRLDKERISAQKRALKAIEETEKIKIANEKMREEACPPPFTAKELASKFINEEKELNNG